MPPFFFGNLTAFTSCIHSEAKRSCSRKVTWMSIPAKIQADPLWGSEYEDVSAIADGAILSCQVRVDDLVAFTTTVVAEVAQSSWMTGLDSLTRKGYEAAVALTAPLLVALANDVGASGTLTEDFGEIMVSISSSRALEVMYCHVSVPISELWKPKSRNNEGFDFHTVCPMHLLNFGEAKYSKSANPHGIAFTQIARFLTNKKHLMDVHYLGTLCSPQSMTRLDFDEYGVIAAFSLNAANKNLVMGRAKSTAKKIALQHALKQVMVVGVSYAGK